MAPPDAAIAEPACDPARPGVVCTCDLAALHPLQGAIGFAEVDAKVKDIQADADGEREKLRRDPIRVVTGPDGAFYIIDHHHGAYAWIRAAGPDGLCKIAARAPFPSEDAFWAGLARDGLIRLADENGRPLAPAQLPRTLGAMPDDPYRSLAWRVRKDRGFCRPAGHREFIEFAWADWFRSRAELPPGDVRNGSDEALRVALALANSPDASSLPGYVATRPSTCPKT